MKKLPIGISTLAKIRDDYIYIDKTHHIERLANQGGQYYFLSRPRRFGKSLLIDTLKQAFLGNKVCFNGLYLENNWDWDKVYPVIHLSFGGSSAYQSKARLLAVINSSLDRHAKYYGVRLSQTDYGEAFSELIKKIAEKAKQPVVLLIDEYDKPILDVIDKPEEATTNREILKGLYSFIKENDTYLKFVLLTGVSKFSKVSLFSGLNNLDDISLDPRYADICGYTQSELEAAFKNYLDAGKVDLDKLKIWYNGYNFAGITEQKVYNPFDILLFCSKNYAYKNYWFETATPSFLMKLIEKNQYYIPSFESFRVTDESLSSFDVGNMPLSTLLFQTGYLTIAKPTQLGTQYGYYLSYPNLEVKASLNAHLAQLGSTLENRNQKMGMLDDCLLANDFDKIGELFTSHFASIPNDWYRNNPMGQYEGFYASVIYSYFCALGYNTRAEDVTNIGKIDLSIELPDKILILEFKLSKLGNAQSAVQQIKDKNYPQKFVHHKKPIYLLGISFDDKQKQVADYLWEEYAEV